MMKSKQKRLIFCLASLWAISNFLFGSTGLSATPTRQVSPLIRTFILGSSEQGRPIEVVQIGTGPRKLVIVGDTHGGPEANTYQLTLQLIAHFKANPENVPQTVSLYLIPTINPDGLALDSRFNAHQVDLNRNMNTNLDACPENDWQTTVHGANGLVSDTGGPFMQSEGESRLIRDFLLDAAGAIFLHSNAGLVFPAFCEHLPSIKLAKVYAQASNYQYNRFWENYPIRGNMADWASSLGIAAITPELTTGEESEFAQNLAGVEEVLAQAEDLLPLAQDQIENKITTPAIIWRYWFTNGAEAVFGMPLEPASQRPDGTIVQNFVRFRLELKPSLKDTPYYVQPAALGSKRLQTLALQNPAFQPLPHVVCKTEPCPLFFAQTGHTLRESFLIYWQRNGGLNLFGYPLSEEFETLTADGQLRIIQYFERAIFAYYPETKNVHLEPLGWQTLLLEKTQTSGVKDQIR